MPKPTAPPTRFGLPCPANQCRGFLSSAYKCGLCAVWVCPECRVVKGTERNANHTCLPDDVASVQLLRESTRPCPECRVPIERSEGCAQMWCTQCHTAFDWTSGNKVTGGVIHNPHYVAFQMRQRQSGLVFRDGLDPCPQDARGQIRHLYQQGLRRLVPWNRAGWEVVDLTMRILLFLVDADDTMWAPRRGNWTRRWQVLSDGELRKHLETLRVKYLRNEITNEVWKRSLYQLERKRTKAQGLQDVWQTFWQASADILTALAAAAATLAANEDLDASVADIRSEPAPTSEPTREPTCKPMDVLVMQHVDQWVNLVTYCNREWAHLSDLFSHCQVPHVVINMATPPRADGFHCSFKAVHPHLEATKADDQGMHAQWAQLRSLYVPGGSAP